MTLLQTLPTTLSIQLGLARLRLLLKGWLRKPPEMGQQRRLVVSLLGRRMASGRRKRWMLQVAKKARPLPSSPYQMGRRMDLPVLFCAVCDARLPVCAQYQWHDGCRVSGARGCMPSALALGPAGLEMAATCTSTRSGARPRCLRAHQQLLALSR